MRILFFTDNLRAGGKERRLTELMKSLLPVKNIIFELVLMSRDIHYREVNELNINTHYLIRKSKRDSSVYWKLYSLCKDFKPDIIHCWDSMTAVYSVPVCKILRIKFINGMVTNSPQKRNISNKYWLRAKLTFPFSDRIIGNSLAGLNAYKAPPKKSVVIHNGFNFGRINGIVPRNEIAEQLGIRTRLIVGMVATCSAAKDYKTYFEAASIILKSRKDVTFLAIGNDTDSDICKGLIDKQFSEYFRFLGRRSDIESLINSMDLCVLSSFSEGLSNAVMEYMALGKPVIASSGGGTNELLVDNQTGFLVNQSDPEQLAVKMETLLRDEHLRNIMGSAGKQRIVKDFPIEKMVNKYIDIYNSLLLY